MLDKNTPNKKSIYNKINNWQQFQEYNETDAKLKATKLKEINISVNDADIIGVLTKSNFVIPGVTRFECVQCGECCRYARKVANLTYEPCLYLTPQNTCKKHDDNYHVCKWFPFWLYSDPNYGVLLTIKPYCSGYNKGPLVDYDAKIKMLVQLETMHKKDEDGAFVIHEVLYLPEKKAWFFPSRRNIDQLIEYITKENNIKKVDCHNSPQGELYFAQQSTSGLLGSVHDPQLTVNEKGYITDANEAFAQLCKTNMNNIKGVLFNNLFLNKELIESKIKLCFSKGKLTAIPNRLILPDNTAINVLINGQIYRDRSDGLVHNLILSILRIDGAVYNDLVSSQEYARNIIEASIDSMMTIDIDGVITDVNEACCTLFGYQREIIQGSKFSNYFDDSKKALEGVDLTYKNEKLKNYELNLINHQKESIPVSFNASVFKNSDGIALGIIAIARDIRETKALIAELENAKQYARGLIESSIDMMLTIDINGNITDINEAVVSNTGFSRNSIIGSKFSSYFNNQEMAEKGVALTFEKTCVRNYELTIISKNKNKINVSFNASLYKNSKNIVQGIFAIARII